MARININNVLTNTFKSNTVTLANLYLNYLEETDQKTYRKILEVGEKVIQQQGSNAVFNQGSDIKMMYKSDMALYNSYYYRVASVDRPYFSLCVKACIFNRVIENNSDLSSKYPLWQPLCNTNPAMLNCKEQEYYLCIFDYAKRLFEESKSASLLRSICESLERKFDQNIQKELIHYFKTSGFTSDIFNSFLEDPRINGHTTRQEDLQTLVCFYYRLMARQHTLSFTIGYHWAYEKTASIANASVKQPVIVSWKQTPPESEPNPTTINEESTTMAQVLDQFENVTKAEVTLIHGRPASEWTEAQLVKQIREAKKAQADIADLVSISSRMKKKHDQLEADIQVYLDLLDKLEEGDEA